jgi:hypothetical protein
LRAVRARMKPFGRSTYPQVKALFKDEGGRGQLSCGTLRIRRLGKWMAFMDSHAPCIRACARPMSASRSNLSQGDARPEDVGPPLTRRRLVITG